MLAEPHRKWRIITSEKHSTTWDGDQMLFDMNFSAFGISADEALVAARIEGGEELTPGKFIKVNFAEHYSKETIGIPIKIK